MSSLLPRVPQSSAPSRVIVFTWSQPQAIAIFFMFRSKFSIEDRIGSRRLTVCNFSCSMSPESNSPKAHSWVRSWKVHSTFYCFSTIVPEGVVRSEPARERHRRLITSRRLQSLRLSAGCRVADWQTTQCSQTSTLNEVKNFVKHQRCSFGNLNS